MKDNLDNLHKQLVTHKNALEKVDGFIKKLEGKAREGRKSDDSDDEHEHRQTNLASKVMRANKSFEEIGDRNRDRSSRGDTGLKRKLSENEDLKRSVRGRRDEQDTRTPSAPSHGKNIKSKEDLITIQNKFSGGEQRNKRIFGVLLGTLKQFKNDDSERSSTAQALNRKELEAKVEIRKIEESKKIIEERRRLEKEKYKEVRSIQILEDKIRLTENFEAWKKDRLNMKKSIRTKALPHIFYLPKSMNDSLNKLLEESAASIESEIKTRQKVTEAEIEMLNAESLKLMESIGDAYVEEAIEGKSKDSVEAQGNGEVIVDNKENLKSDLVDIDLDEDKNEINVRLGDEDELEEKNIDNVSVSNDSNAI